MIVEYLKQPIDFIKFANIYIKDYEKDPIIFKELSFI